MQKDVTDGADDLHAEFQQPVANSITCARAHVVPATDAFAWRRSARWDDHHELVRPHPLMTEERDVAPIMA